MAIARKTKVPRAGPCVFKRSYKSFCEDEFIDQIKNLQWDRVCAVNDTGVALQMFSEMLLTVADKHSPKKSSL